MKKTIELEFAFNTPPGLLFSRLSTPHGLAEWFADDVNLNGNIFTFIWDKAEHQAEVISIKENKYIRFKWIGNGASIGEERFLEFKLCPNEMAGGVALHVTEMISDTETEDAISLWNYQIGELKRNLGE